MPRTSSSQQRRAQFLLTVLATTPTATLKRALRQHGIKDKAFVKRLNQVLTDHSSIADAPRQGRPKRHPDATLQQCLAWLESLDHPCHSAQELLECLVQRGILPPGTASRGFMTAFRGYLASRGLQLKYGQRALTFPLSQRHIKERLQWCKENQKTFTKQALGGYVFADEISIEQGGVPKGVQAWPGGWEECMAPAQQAQHGPH